MVQNLLFCFIILFTRMMIVGDRAAKRLGFKAKRSIDNGSLSNSDAEYVLPHRRHISNSLHRKQVESHNQSHKNTEIYFDFFKKKQYLKSLINDYFGEDKKHESYQLPPNSVVNISAPVTMPAIKRRSVSMKAGQATHSYENPLHNQETEDLSKSIDLYEMNIPGEGHQWDKSAPNPMLPPIHESSEDLSNMDTVSESFYPESSLYSMTDLSVKKISQETKALSFQNEVIRVYVSIRNGRVRNRIKEYKQEGYELLKREHKILKYNLPAVWKQSKYSETSFVCGMRQPLKEELMRIIPEENYCKIVPKKWHEKIVANHCEELLMILKNFCQDLQLVEGKVINNKINLVNLFLQSDYQLAIAEWGHSAFREEFNIQNNMFESRLDPILKTEKEWLVSPEYLAPQILENIHKNKENQVWDNGSASDIWSLGVTLFEMLTLIPVWMPKKAVVRGKSYQPRTGIMASPQRDIKFLLNRQKILQKIVQKVLSTELAPQDSNDKLNKLILRMLELKPQRRILLKEIIEEL